MGHTSHRSLHLVQVMVVPLSNSMLCLTTWLLPLCILLILQTAFGCLSPPPKTGSCQCGVKNSITSKIVGGKPADKHEYPWMVALVYRGHNDKGPFCGGSLITERHVLTAAHCFKDETKEGIQVLVGFHRINDKTDFDEHDVSNIEKHKKYDPTDPTVNYDFAILTIHPSVRPSMLMPVCLPADINTKYVGRWATVTGWGRVSTKGPKSPVLKEVDIKVTSDEVCKAIYRVDSSNICAMAPGKNSCKGDSGGPLIVQENGKWTLVGVVNGGHSKGCAAPGIPAVYGRVTEVMDWIHTSTTGASAYNSVCK